MSYCPLVERLGFDENFMDITKMVEARLAETPVPDKLSFKGNVYNHISESFLGVELHTSGSWKPEKSCETSTEA